MAEELLLCDPLLGVPLEAQLEQVGKEAVLDEVPVLGEHFGNIGLVRCLGQEDPGGQLEADRSEGVDVSGVAHVASIAHSEPSVLVQHLRGGVPLRADALGHCGVAGHEDLGHAEVRDSHMERVLVDHEDVSRL